MRGHVSSYPIKLPWILFKISTACFIYVNRAVISNQILTIPKSSVHTACLGMLNSIDISFKYSISISLFSFLWYLDFISLMQFLRLISPLPPLDYSFWLPERKINTCMHTVLQHPLKAVQTHTYIYIYLF